jgi:hypothetical protein
MGLDRIEAHCDEIDRCNQRGGRMLSIVDLIEAGTIGPELAAYLLGAVGGGASFLVGAMPGGAGKTTVMGALLNFVPAGVPLAPADGLDTMERASTASASSRRCFICHEIGSGPYYAYLWGPELRRYFELGEAGHILATNLHADTYEQARAQICDVNGVPPSQLRRMNLMLFLSVGRRGAGRRCVEEVWESDGRTPHRKLYQLAAGAKLTPSSLVSDETMAQAAQRIEGLLSSGARTIRQVRTFLVGEG